MNIHLGRLCQDVLQRIKTAPSGLAQIQMEETAVSSHGPKKRHMRSQKQSVGDCRKVRNALNVLILWSTALLGQIMKTRAVPITSATSVIPMHHYADGFSAHVTLRLVRDLLALTGSFVSRARTLPRCMLLSCADPGLLFTKSPTHVNPATFSAFH